MDMDCAQLCNDNNDGKISKLSVKILPIATLLLTVSITIFMPLRSEGAALNYFVSFFFKSRCHNILKENI